MLQNLPLDTGMAFVLVQHLDPAHESALTSLLAKATTMPVAEVKNGVKVEPNHVYVIPPNWNMTISRGVLKLQPRRNTAGAHRSIDFFFESLAQDQSERAIGVVLSGSATDGTHGTEMIKAEGGITFAQDDSAKYDSMPRSAVAAGCIDFVLSPRGIAQELTEIARHPLVSGKRALRRKQAPSEEAAPLAAGGENTFKKILDLLRHHRGVDFSSYKPNTIERRILRRMVLNKLSALGDYAAFLKGNQQELDLLYSDVLISVTSFFRNPEAFEALKTRVFPQLLRDRKRDDPVRVWTLGCSTGQEAYSIAMAYMEFSSNVVGAPRLQVFATDLNETLLDKARHGLYSKSLADEISPERLRRFFTEEQGGYRISKPLRETCIFSRQNVLSDPPFSRMDLISCRNLIIYIETHLQRRILPNFHYALKPGGFLFLGASESIGPFTDLFEPVDKKQKIFAKKTRALPAYHLPVFSGRSTQKKGVFVKPQSLSDVLGVEATAQREADRIVASHFAPPGVLINAELEVLQFRGATNAYVGPPPGKASFNLLKMARPALVLPLRAAINRAKKENRPVPLKNVRLDENGSSKTINIEVVPLKNLKEICYLVLFMPAKKSAETDESELPQPPEENKGKGSRSRTATDSRRIAELERELAEARDYAQSLQEQHEAANEELQASNEEVQSANEELQSINEELETSKEELESTNEELTTVNEEMATRNTELNRVNSDLNNLHASINTAILLLGRDLTVRRFTPVAEKIFNLLPTDFGRSLNSIRHTLDFPDLEKFVAEIIDKVTVREREVQDKDGRWFVLRARPYLTLDNKIDVAVLVLTDIDDLKFKEQEIREARDYAQGIVETVPPLLVLDKELRVLTANDSFYKHFGVTPAKTETVLIYELEHGQWNIPKLRRLLEAILPRNSFFEGFEVTHDFGSRGKRTLLLSARRLENSRRILLSIDDITERLRLEESVRRSELRFRRLFETAQDGLLMLDPETRRITAANPFIVSFLGYPLEELLGKELWEIGLLKDAAASREAFRQLKAKGSIRFENLPLRTKAGQSREVEFVNSIYREDGDEVIQCNIRDITERKRTEEALRANEERFRALFELGPVAVYSCDASGVIHEFNRRAVELWGRKPAPGDTDELFCGSHKMFRPDGSFMPHEQCPMAEVLAGKIPAARDAEVLIERPDGSRIAVVVNIRPLKNQRGEVEGAINCFYDITERKQAEMAAASLAAIVESSDDTIISIDLDSVIISWNKGAERLFGYTAQEIIGQSITTLIPPAHQHEESGIIERIKHGKQVETFETVRLRKDGSLVEVSLTISPIRNLSGQVIGASKIARDITERKKTEDTLRRAQAQLTDHAGELEKAVSARTAELTSMNNQMEAFVYSIAHDLRAPLRAMEGFSSMLVEEAGASLSRAGQDFAKRISRSAQFMDSLLMNLLTFSRVSQQSVELTAVDPESAINAELSRLEDEIQEKKAQVEVKGPWPRVLAHEPTLNQVLCNLLSNALKFSKPDAPALIRIWPEEAQGAPVPSVRIWVEDNGIGIAPEHQEETFRLFTRLHGDKFPGTGFGLAIVQKGVEHMGGRVGVESALGNGARFWFELQKA